MDDVREGKGFRVEVDPPVAIFKVDSEFFAIEDTCTHADFSLSEGYVEDGIVECPLHMAKFCVRTGGVVCSPATEPVKTFAVRVDNGAVLVKLPDLAI